MMPSVQPAEGSDFPGSSHARTGILVFLALLALAGCGGDPLSPVGGHAPAVAVASDSAQDGRLVEGARSASETPPSEAQPSGSREAADPAVAAPAVPKKVQYAYDPSASWLIAHADPDGGWPRRAEGSEAAPPLDVAATSLALLTFLSQGYTHRSEGDGGVGTAIGLALRRMKSLQAADGQLAGTSSQDAVRAHALATLALLEDYGMTESVVVREPARRAFAALLGLRKESGGWASDAGARGDDAEATAFAVLACAQAGQIVKWQRAAERVPEIPVEASLLDSFRSWAEREGRSAAGSAVRVEAAQVIALAVGGEDPTSSNDVLDAVARIRAACQGDAVALDPVERFLSMVAITVTGCERSESWRKAFFEDLTRLQRGGKDPVELRGSFDPPAGDLRATARTEATALWTLAEWPTRCCYGPPRLR